MRYKTLVRLALKVIGVYVFVQSAHTLIYFATQAWYLFGGTNRPFPSWDWLVPQGIVGALQMGLGLYLFFGGKWVANLAIPSNRPYCQECAYDLTGAATTRCPECGTPFRWEDVMPAGQPLTPCPQDSNSASRGEAG